MATRRKRQRVTISLWEVIMIGAVLIVGWTLYQSGQSSVNGFVGLAAGIGGTWYTWRNVRDIGGLFDYGLFLLALYAMVRIVGHITGVWTFGPEWY